MKQSVEVLKAIAVTAELLGTELSEAALRAFERRLSAYSEAQALAALDKCQVELRGRLTVADVIDRISSVGGHPSANEAWALVLASRDESDTVVWTEQIAEAAGIAQPVLDAGDEIGARMAFRDAYERILRERFESTRWFPSLGSDPVRRQDALDRAVTAGRLSSQHAAGLLPPPINAKGAVIAGLLGGPPVAMPEDAEFRRRIAGLLAKIKGGDAA